VKTQRDHHVTVVAFTDRGIRSAGLAQDGKTMVLGELGNPSNGTGIQGPRNASSPGAGAFWLY